MIIYACVCVSVSVCGMYFVSLSPSLSYICKHIKSTILCYRSCRTIKIPHAVVIPTVPTTPHI